MNSWTVAALVAAGIAAVGVPVLRRYAYRHGYFERGPRTDRPRGQRRTTVAGPVLIVAVAVGAVAGDARGAALRALLVAGAIILVTGWRSERARHAGFLHIGGRIAAAGAVSVVGVRLHLTGVTAIDAVLTAAVVLAVAGSFAGLYRVDGVATAMGGTSAAAVTLLAGASGQGDVRIVAAAILGGCAGVLLHSLPPAETTLGRTGGPFVGIAIAIATIELEPPASAPASLLVPILLVGLPVVAAAAAVYAHARRPDATGPAVYLDQRLAKRLGPGAVVVLLAGAQAGLSAIAYAVGDERMGGGVGAIAGIAIGAIVLSLAFSTSAEDAAVTGLPRWARRAMAATILAVVALGGYAVFVVAGARTHLEAGRNAAQQGLDAARDGDSDVAKVQFAKAHKEFSQADSLISFPLFDVTRVLPVVSQNVEAVKAVTDIGLAISDTGERLATRAGAPELRIIDGRLPVAETRKVARDLHEAVDVVKVSARKLEAVQSPYLASPVEEAVGTLADKIAGVQGEVNTVDEAVTLAPGLFGGDGMRRYFLVIQTPAELRGSGGLLGNFGEVTATDGKLEMPRVEAVRVLNNATDRARQATLLPPVYRTNYAGYAVDSLWQNITAPADFPTTAQAIEAAYPATSGGQPVDGVIAIDPVGIAALLKLTGPVQVDAWPEPINADNAERILLFDQYEQLEGEVRDDFLGDVAHAVFDKLTSGELPAPSKIVNTLAPVVSGGHLRLHSVRTDEQRLFFDIDAEGGLPTGPDSLMLTSQNGSESKIDYYLHRSLTYDVAYDSKTGATEATATVTLRNDAPDRGVTNVIIGGERNGPTGPGESRLFVTLYSPLSLDAATLDGSEVGIASASEAGLSSYTVLTRIPAGATQTLVLKLSGQLPRAPNYTLAVGHQPTVNPDHIEVHVSNTNGRQYQVIEPSNAKNSGQELVEPVRLVAQLLP